MKNKILLSIIIPKINYEFEIYIPNNKKIGTIKNKIIDDYLKKNIINVPNINSFRLIDRDTGIEFDNNL